MTTLKFGKFAGQNIRVVPDDYLRFLRDSSEKTMQECDAELERREAASEADMSVMQRIVEEGFRALAKKHHPDLNGGDGRMMQEINSAAERLREVVAE